MTSIITNPLNTRVDFSTDDLDELVDYYGGYGSHRRITKGRGPLEYKAVCSFANQTLASWTHLGLSQFIEATPVDPLIQIPLESGRTYQLGSRCLDVKPGSAVFIAPERKYSIISPPAGDNLTIKLDQQMLIRELNSRLSVDESFAYPLHTHFLLTDQAKRDLIQILHELLFFADASSGDRIDWKKKVDIAFVDWAADRLFPPDSGKERLTPGSRTMERVEAWIDDNLAEPITLGSLCAVAGIGARGLQKAFLRRRQCSPKDWVTERRLAAARVRLAKADQDESVTSIALGCGFSHMGRFSMHCREKYGSLPSTLLRQPINYSHNLG